MRRSVNVPGARYCCIVQSSPGKVHLKSCLSTGILESLVSLYVGGQPPRLSGMLHWWQAVVLAPWSTGTLYSETSTKSLPRGLTEMDLTETSSVAIWLNLGFPLVEDCSTWYFPCGNMAVWLTSHHSPSLWLSVLWWAASLTPDPQAGYSLLHYTKRTEKLSLKCFNLHIQIS